MSKTILKDRVLWFDGDSTITFNQLEARINSGLPVRGLMTESSSEVLTKLNRMFNQEDQILVKSSLKELNFDWNIPEEYLTLKVAPYIFDLAYQWCVSNGFETDETKVEQILDRVKHELELYKKYDLFMLLRVLIFIINTLQSHNVVWGVGRGSCVSSYVLYLIGVHDVDSFQYSLNIEDFLHD